MMRKLVVGLTGATGAIYGIRLLQVLAERNDVETHLVISSAAEVTIGCETDWTVEKVKALAACTYRNDELASRISSGSFLHSGMIVAPCTVKTLSAIANSYCETLVARAADVSLKERRPLVLVVRETPLHLGHLRLMERLAEMGAIILPPVPAFYHRPQGLQDIIDHTVGKILDVLGIEHALFARWKGLNGGPVAH